MYCSQQSVNRIINSTSNPIALEVVGSSPKSIYPFDVDQPIRREPSCMVFCRMGKTKRKQKAYNQSKLRWIHLTLYLHTRQLFIQSNQLTLLTILGSPDLTGNLLSYCCEAIFLSNFWLIAISSIYINNNNNMILDTCICCCLFNANNSNTYYHQSFVITPP